MIYIGTLLGYIMKNGRNTAGKFTAGNSGRPKGAKNKKNPNNRELIRSSSDIN